MRNTPWLKFIGTDYIEIAFRTAAIADPKALLVYNEWGLEYNEAHQDTVLELLERLKAKGTPLHALGIQSHLYSDREFKPQNFRKFLRNVAKLGLKIMITELDVLDAKFPLDINRRDRLVAGIYEDYLNVVLAEKAVTTVINWGISDSHNWITETEPRRDRGQPRPLVFDRQMKPKLAWNAIARAFDQSPTR